MSMQELYILVEGEPDSPELPFLQYTITAILRKNHKPYIAKIFEIGGCSALSNGNLAKTFYKLSEAHKTIPVLAIADSDYRLSRDKRPIDNTALLEKKKAKILYWKKHEWENYLLEETQLIADFVNEFPDNATTGKVKYRKNKGLTITKEDLDTFLLEYFIENIRNEFFECLSFNLNSTKSVDIPRSISKPDTFEQDNIETIKNWFSTYFNDKSAIISFVREGIYEEIITEYAWNALINNPNELSFNFAKDKFRGKEALNSLINFMAQKGCIIPKEQFQIDLLKRLDSNSAIFQNLEESLLAELL